MNKRRFLIISTAGLLIGGLAAASFPFLGSMKPSEKAKNDDLVLIDLPKLHPGQLLELTVEGRRLLVLRPNEEQRESIRILSDHVWDSDSYAYNAGIGAYVYWGESTRWGCPLDDKPPQESRIKQWDENAEWLGGFWDPWCEVSYDYAGRSIKSYMYTYNGYSAKYPNLRAPKIFKKENGRYVVSRRER